MAEWIDIGVAAEILGRSRAAARVAMKKAGLERRAVMVTAGNGASRAYLYLRADVEGLRDERQAQRQARRDRDAKKRERARAKRAAVDKEQRKRDQVARSGFVIAPGRRKRRPPPDKIDRRVAQLAPVSAVRRPDLTGAVACEPGEPGAIELAAGRWVRPA